VTELVSHEDVYKEAMASFPSGVTIVTTTDPNGRWWGFTATAFSSVSVDPPLVLVCLSNNAECYPVFDAAAHWRVHIVSPKHADLAMRFATRGADKFADAGFVEDAFGLPHLAQAAVTLRCSRFAQHEGGDHTILVGRVEETLLVPEATPTVYYRRGFRQLAV
jgi:flavin reductase ActVB